MVVPLSFRYLPHVAGVWYQGGKNYDPNDGHENGTTTWSLTNASEAAFEFTFSGVAVALYGAVDPKYGKYRVQVDGDGGNDTYSSNAIFNSKQQVLYFKDGLKLKTHTLHLDVVRLNGTVNGFSIDSAQTWAVPGGGGCVINNSFVIL